MRATMCPKAIILTKAYKAMVSMIAKGISSSEFFSEVFLICTTQFCSFPSTYDALSCIHNLLKKGLLQEEYF